MVENIILNAAIAFQLLSLLQIADCCEIRMMEGGGGHHLLLVVRDQEAELLHLKLTTGVAHFFVRSADGGDHYEPISFCGAVLKSIALQVVADQIAANCGWGTRPWNATYESRGLMALGLLLQRFCLGPFSVTVENGFVVNGRCADWLRQMEDREEVGYITSDRLAADYWLVKGPVASFVFWLSEATAITEEGFLSLNKSDACSMRDALYVAEKYLRGDVQTLHC